MPVNPLPVSREASRDFVALDRPFDDGRVRTTNVAVSTSTVSENILDDLNFMFRATRPLYLRHVSDMHEAAEKGVSDERGRTKTKKEAWWSKCAAPRGGYEQSQGNIILLKRRSIRRGNLSTSKK